MDRNVKIRYASLWIEKDRFNAHKKEAEKEYDGTQEEELKGQGYIFQELNYVVDEYYVDSTGGKPEIQLSGDTKLGYLSLSLPVTNNLAKEIIEIYMKRVARMKTMLEAAGKLEEE